MSSAVTAHDSQSGFTLLEILVALVISSLIMVGLGLAMSSINRGYDSTTASIERQGTISTGLHVVAQDISRIERAVDAAKQPPQFLFSGGPEEVIYVLGERPGNNRAGLYWVRLLVRKSQGGTELVRMRAPFIRKEADLGSVAWEDEVVLIRGGMGIGFLYRAPRSGLRSWGNSWAAGNMLPGQIGVSITDLATGRLRVPFAVMPLKISAEADCVVADAPGCTLAGEGALTAENRTR